MKKLTLFVIPAFIMLIASCVSVEKLSYFSDSDKDILAELQNPEQNRIKPKDELYIKVSSFDDVAYNFFTNQQSANFSSFQNEQSISLNSFAVDDSGFIYFPILGQVAMKGLTVEEGAEKLKGLLSEYFNQPTVILKLVNKKITLLGEVLRPGSYLYTKERLNVFEALGLAGDINQYGNRERVVLIREQDGKLIKRTLNLNTTGILTDQDFFLRQDDILYIAPQGTKRWTAISSPWALTLTTITTIILMLNYIDRI